MKSIEPLSGNRDPKTTQNEHVYAIFCRPEVYDDVIAGNDVYTFRQYACVNLTAGQLEPNFLGQRAKLSHKLQKRK